MTRLENSFHEMTTYCKVLAQKIGEDGKRSVPRWISRSNEEIKMAGVPFNATEKILKK